MQLKLQRSQKTSGLMGKSVTFCLDARAELTPEEVASVKKYHLGKQVIYDSAATRKHIESGRHALGTSGAGGVLKGATALAMSKFSLSMTIDGLAKGHHIECKDLDEMLGAEEAVRTGCTTMKEYLEAAATFDGREEVVEF